MPINFGGDDVSAITMDGDDITEVTMDGDVVWSAVSGISSATHLDIEGANDYVDLSSHSVTVGTENAFLTWIRPQSLGSSGHNAYPGIAAESQDAFDGWFSFQDESGDGPHSSGTHDASMWLDTDGGSEQIGPTFSLELGAWHLVGFSVDANDVLTWYVDGSAIGTNDYGTFDGLTLNNVGYGYANATDAGTGGKDIDETMVFNRELSESEVNDFWNASAFPSPAAHHYRYEDDGDTTTATDSEGSADGSISGGAYESPGAFGGGGNGNGGSATVIDSFEDQDLSEYTGSPDSYDVTQTFATDGSWCLERSGITGIPEIVSASGLDNYFAKGQEYRVDVQTNTSAANASTNLRPGPMWGAADTSNHYFAQIVVDGNPHVRVFSIDGGSTNTIDGGQTDLSEWDADTTYTFAVQWDDGSTFGGSDNDMSWSVERADDGTVIGSDTVNDSTHATNTGIGFRTGAGDTSYTILFDYARVIGGGGSEPSTVIDDFERSSPLDEYSGGTGLFTTTDAANALEGDQSLQNDDAFGFVARTDGGGDMSRGNVYRLKCQLNPASENGQVIFASQDQASGGSINDDSYIIDLFGGGDEFGLLEYQGGSETNATNETFSYTSGEVYDIEFEYGPTGQSDNIVARLFDSGGTQVAGDISLSSDAHTGGVFGFYCGSSSTTGTFVYDHVREEPL